MPVDRLLLDQLELVPGFLVHLQLAVSCLSLFHIDKIEATNPENPLLSTIILA